MYWNRDTLYTGIKNEETGREAGQQAGKEKMERRDRGREEKERHGTGDTRTLNMAGNTPHGANCVE